jgi:hypothetical protein
VAVGGNARWVMRGNGWQWVAGSGWQCQILLTLFGWGGGGGGGADSDMHISGWIEPAGSAGLGP